MCIYGVSISKQALSDVFLYLILRDVLRIRNECSHYKDEAQRG